VDLEHLAVPSTDEDVFTAREKAIMRRWRFDSHMLTEDAWLSVG
jgi:hypothetical protein